MIGKTPSRALPKAAGIAGLLALLLVGLSSSPAMAQSSGWNTTITFSSSLQAGQNQLISAIVTFNGVPTDPAAVNGTLITPQGTEVNLIGFVDVSTGLWQTLYQLPDNTGSYFITVTAYNGTETATAWGTFSGLQSNVPALSSITTSVGSVQGNLTEVKSMLSAIQSSDSSLSSQITTGNNGIQSAISGLSAQLSSLANSVSGVSTTASNAEYYALGALVVALIAVVVSAYGVMRKP
ncbi:MAG: hypothetical protein JRN27_05220 [Nitrososphaerota archaeon]|nr:hypothetical protein [Nitrososphaerota archaeon]MDG6975471.1 hypothetical protein [Nitrososphaerota archaeon]